ncbi:hypothetical protein LT85_0701 [Collimonas arenae]|uniref:Uncharacterized protein n=1 Tax=Collimonas arenae TaxID=279058 RepID=A0A0A1F5S5_9BURK|nr:hypothetical protein LT85_0701 [Collimonas arenae]
MNIEIFSILNMPLTGERATRLTEHASRQLAALLVLAGMCLLRPRALPAAAMHTHSDVFNYGS